MQARVSRILSKIDIPQKSRAFSSPPNRPIRRDRRTEPNQSEETFLKNLNFGDPNPSNPPAPIPNRPLRGAHPPVNTEVREKDQRRPKDDTFHHKKQSFIDNNHLNKRDNVEKDDGLLFKFGDQRGQRPIRTGKDQPLVDEDSVLQSLNLGDVGGGKIQQEVSSEPCLPPREAPPEEAEEIFKKMKQSGLIPNAVAMLDGLCKDGLVQEAMKLFGLMREKGTIPEVVIYTAVVEGFCKAAKYDDAKRIFRKMQKNGIVPNAFSYMVLVQGLCRGKRLEEGVEFCVEMLEVGHAPNAATLVGLVDGVCVEKGVEEAESFVRSLREKGFAIDEKAVREHLDKKGPFSPMVWQAILGKKKEQRAF